MDHTADIKDDASASRAAPASQVGLAVAVTPNSPKADTAAVPTSKIKSKTPATELSESPAGEEVLPTDVIFGKGQGCVFHPGNVQLRELVRKNLKYYSALSLRKRDARKLGLVKKLVSQFYAMNGRFVELLPMTNVDDARCVPVTDEVLISKKVMQTFRDERKKQDNRAKAKKNASVKGKDDAASKASKAAAKIGQASEPEPDDSCFIDDSTTETPEKSTSSIHENSTSSIVHPKDGVRPMDVIFGTFSGCFKHAGNTNFRHLIRQNLDTWSALPRGDSAKTVLATCVMEHIYEAEGRFVVLAPDSAKSVKEGKFIAVTDSRLILNKIAQCFRDERKKMDQDSVGPKKRKDNGSSCSQCSIAPTKKSKASKVKRDNSCSEEWLFAQAVKKEIILAKSSLKEGKLSELRRIVVGVGQPTKSPSASPGELLASTIDGFSGELVDDWLDNDQKKQCAALSSEWKRFYNGENAWTRDSSWPPQWFRCEPSLPEWTAGELRLMELLLGAACEFETSWTSILQYAFLDRQKELCLYFWHTFEGKERHDLGGLLPSQYIPMAKSLAKSLVEEHCANGAPKKQPHPVEQTEKELREQGIIFDGMDPAAIKEKVAYAAVMKDEKRRPCIEDIAAEVEKDDDEENESLSSPSESNAGVSLRISGRWLAELEDDEEGTAHHIGVFDSEEKAALAVHICQIRLKSGPKGDKHHFELAKRAALQGVKRRYG